MTLTKEFYGSIRESLFHKLSQSQVEGMEALAKEANMSLSQFAYVLATVYHECGGTMQPIAEYGKGANMKYGHHIKQSGQAYTSPNQLYYGRGFCQLTWYENYDKFGKLLGVDLLNNPDMAMNIDIASKIIILGMTKGLFTGKKLEDYINTKEDTINARRIINGVRKGELLPDKAELIQTYFYKFKTALGA